MGAETSLSTELKPRFFVLNYFNLLDLDWLITYASLGCYLYKCIYIILYPCLL